jgi:3-oxoacyl-[acyl-carrier-protein] synthase-3
MNILNVAYQMGEYKISVKELYPGIDLIDKTGIPFVYETKHKTIVLASKACEKIPKEYLQDINLVLFVTQSPDDLLPSNSISLANIIGLTGEVMTFDINQGCSGFVQTLCIIDALITKYPRILFITADRYRSKLNPRDRSTNAVFSDGATASIWVKEGPKKILYENTVTFSDTRDLLFQSTSKLENEGFLHMSGAEVWMFTKLKVVPQIIEAIKYCTMMNINIKDIYIHQASKVVVNGIKDALAAYNLNILSNYENYGNTVSSTIPILIADNFEKFTKDNNVSILAGFGVGLTSTVAVYG